MNRYSFLLTDRQTVINVVSELSNNYEQYKLLSYRYLYNTIYILIHTLFLIPPPPLSLLPFLFVIVYNISRFLIERSVYVPNLKEANGYHQIDIILDLKIPILVPVLVHTNSSNSINKGEHDDSMKSSLAVGDSIDVSIKDSIQAYVDSKRIEMNDKGIVLLQFYDLLGVPVKLEFIDQQQFFDFLHRLLLVIERYQYSTTSTTTTEEISAPMVTVLKLPPQRRITAAATITVTTVKATATTTNKLAKGTIVQLPIITTNTPFLITSTATANNSSSEANYYYIITIKIFLKSAIVKSIFEQKITYVTLVLSSTYLLASCFVLLYPILSF